jgi:amidase
LLFDVMTGPAQGEDVAWRIQLPAARHAALRDFRVAVMPPLPWVAPAAEMQAKVDELAAFLARAGAKIEQALPPFDIEQYFHDYLCLLVVESSGGMSREAREAAAARIGRDDPVRAAQAEGFTLDAAGHNALLHRREMAREAWRAFFQDWDLLLGPMALDAAFPHQQGSQDARVLSVDGSEVPYMLNIVYPMWAIFAGQPSTAFPAGLNHAGLPLGLQAIGPYLEDRTALRFVQLLEREWQGFQAPPGYWPA